MHTSIKEEQSTAGQDLTSRQTALAIAIAKHIQAEPQGSSPTASKTAMLTTVKAQVTATQTTRSGFTSSDPGMEDTSESFGLPATADLMFALISSEELESLGQVMVKQLKNRYNDPNYKKRFVLGIDRSRMKLFDVENAEEGVVDDAPIPDRSRINSSDFKME